jgi:hypothetical protein
MVLLPFLSLINHHFTQLAFHDLHDNYYMLLVDQHWSVRVQIKRIQLFAKVYLYIQIKKGLS